MTDAFYRLSVSISNNACVSVAYCLRTKLRNAETKETIDYSPKAKKDLIASGTELCEGAPEEWKDYNKLWNEVFSVDKAKGAQQCRNFIGSLPKGLKNEEYIAITKEFCEELTKQGMCVSWAIHKPTKGTKQVDEVQEDYENPHFHICATLRSVDKTKQKFKPKCKKVYVLDEDGKKQLLLNKDGTPKLGLRGAKQYISKKEYINTWNSWERVPEWRKLFEVIQNKHLERAGRDERVDCRSNEDRGLDRVPQIKLSKKDWQLMEAGETSPRIEKYKLIEQENAERAEDRAALDFLDKKIEQYKKLLQTAKKELAEWKDKLLDILKVETKDSAVAADQTQELRPVSEPDINSREQILQTTTEKMTAQNASASAEVEPVGIKVPPETEEKILASPPVSPAQPERRNFYAAEYFFDLETGDFTGWQPYSEPEIYQTKPQPEEVINDGKKVRVVWFDTLEELQNEGARLADELQEDTEDVRYWRAYQFKPGERLKNGTIEIYETDNGLCGLYKEKSEPYRERFISADTEIFRHLCAGYRKNKIKNGTVLEIKSFVVDETGTKFKDRPMRIDVVDERGIKVER